MTERRGDDRILESVDANRTGWWLMKSLEEKVRRATIQNKG